MSLVRSQVLRDARGETVEIRRLLVRSWDDGRMSVTVATYNERDTYVESSGITLTENDVAALRHHLNGMTD